MSSGFIGNLIAFLLFNGKEDIDKDTRMTLGAILTSVSFAGEKESLRSKQSILSSIFQDLWSSSSSDRCPGLRRATPTSFKH